jgi:hypothetical protein
MYAIWELHACEMAYGRGTHMRDTPKRCTPMREMHAYERYTPMRDTPVGWLL